MAEQVRSFALRLVTSGMLNHLVVLGLALTTVILTTGMPGSGGGGA